MNVYEFTYTDTFSGEPNFAWVRRGTVHMPELTHYGYDGGSNYVKANRIFERELMRKVKRVLGLSGVRGRKYSQGDRIEFIPYRSCTVLFIRHMEC